jgi:cell wall-associated NlpC family hydrolase
MSAPRPDPRRNAVRDDLADARLSGRVDAPRFVNASAARVVVPAAGLRRRPADDAPLDSELIFGEPLRAFDRDGDWCWVQSALDDYVGYVRDAALAPDDAPEPGARETHGRPDTGADAVHRVHMPLALVFREPSIKSPVVMKLPMGARLSTTGEEVAGGERFHAAAGGYVLDQHVLATDAPLEDWVAAAAMFVGAPYLFGGKTWDGIDCSALVQLAIQVAGGRAPRDSDMQEAELGTPVDRGDGGFRRGDLVFWKGHVGIMLDGTRLLHANGFHMATAVEPLADAIARLAARGLAVTSVRHVPPQMAQGA